MRLPVRQRENPDFVTDSGFSGSANFCLPIIGVRRYNPASNLGRRGKRL